jgi:hypothetical protein
LRLGARAVQRLDTGVVHVIIGSAAASWANQLQTKR